MVNLSYNPGQTADIFLEVIASGVRIDADSLPNVTEIWTPQIPSVAAPSPFIPDPNPLLTLPVAMTKLSTGLYYYKYVLQKGSVALGSYIITVSYTVSTVPLLNTYSLQVSAPFANYSVT